MGCGIWNGACGTGMFSHRSRRFSQMPCGLFYQKTRDPAKPHRPTEGNCTEAHGCFFSRIVYSCSAAYCLGFDAPPAQRIDTDFLQAESTMKLYAT